MTATISSIEVYGFSGDPCDESGNKRVFFSSFDDKCRANQRYNLLKANSLRIKGSNLDRVNEIRLSSSSGYRFAVIERRPYGGDLIVYFLVWRNGKGVKGKVPKSLGDLTVTIDTTPPSNTDSETDSSVEYED